MARLRTCADDEMSEETLSSLSFARVNSRLPDVYRQMAGNEAVLGVYLQMEQILVAGSLTAREIEAIKLTLSQWSGCEYCLSVHYRKAVAAGFTAAQCAAIRAVAPIHDARIDALVSTARALVSGHGTLPDATVEHLREQGFSDSDMMELILACATIFLTNSFNHINDTSLTLPPAPELATD